MAPDQGVRADANPNRDEHGQVTEGTRSPICRCHDCRNDEEAGCAVVMFGPDGERVQCGMEGGHDGSCDFWEKAHDEREEAPDA